MNEFRPLASRRLASRTRGDDTTLSRYVPLAGGIHGRPPAPAPEDATGSRFPERVISPRDTPLLLTSGHSNLKIGRDVRKGHFRGYWIYSMSLEERATCPRSCQHWTTCYGNAMPFGKRVDHTDPTFLPALEREVDRLSSMRTRAGLLVRLHALGDFYSEEYVATWDRLLFRNPRLAVFGYTARLPHTPIGRAVQRLVETYGRRAMIRVSDGGMPEMSTVSLADESELPADAFQCPEQTGKTRCCATCGACWGTRKNVAFIAH